jgi:hypothetical protein
MKEIKSVLNSLADSRLTSELKLEDNSSMYIFIQRGMIFVADCDYVTLTQRIEDDEYESFEAYDTCDTTRYYETSEYAEYIDAALLHLANLLL